MSLPRDPARRRAALDTWIIGALECLLPGPKRDPDLARALSRL